MRTPGAGAHRALRIGMVGGPEKSGSGLGQALPWPRGCRLSEAYCEDVSLSEPSFVSSSEPLPEEALDSD